MMGGGVRSGGEKTAGSGSFSGGVVLYLLDAFSLIFRGYYALIRNPLRTKRGENVSAIFGFLNMVVELFRRYRPRYIGVVWEAEGPTFRHALYEKYKSDRPPMPEPIAFGLPHIRSFLSAMGIPVVEVRGAEADDVLATLARKASAQKIPCYVVTSDKDLEQIVDAYCRVLRPAGKGEGYEEIDVVRVEERWGVPPDRVADVLALQGDSVDQIPGVPGIGKKTAQWLIREFGSLEGLYANLDRVGRARLREVLRAHRSQAFLSKELVVLKTDLDIPFRLEDFERRAPDWVRLQSLIQRFEFRRLGKRLMEVLRGEPGQYQGVLFGLGDERDEEVAGTNAREGSGASSSFSGEEVSGKLRLEKGGHRGARSAGTGYLFRVEVGVSEPEEVHVSDVAVRTIETEKPDYELIDSVEGLERVVRKLAEVPRFSLDVETDSISPHRANLLGISLCGQEKKAYYVVYPREEERRVVWRGLLNSLFSSDKEKIGQNLKYDLVVLRRHGFEVCGPYFDTMVAHALVAPEGKHNLDALAIHYLGYEPIPIEQLLGPDKQRNMRELTPEQIKDYAAEDADVTFRLRKPLILELQKLGMETLFYELEMPLLEVLVDLELTGIHVDVDGLRALDERLSRESQRLEKQIIELLGVPINLSSAKQVGEALFVRLKLPYPGRKTATGQYSTSESVLQKIADRHPVIPLLLQYREIQKLRGTYVKGLLSRRHPDTGRLHPTYHQVRTATGRISTSDPNLQNIPVRGEWGRAIRSVFTAGDAAYEMLSLDYSQIELRLIAHFSGDERLIEAFQADRDIHTETAVRLFGVGPEEVTPEMRRRAKAVNFGIFYGISAHGLAEQLKISRSEAREIIQRYFATFPKVQAYIEELLREAREKGYVETLLGRRRYLPELHSMNPVVRGHAERAAMNTPIQGSAADLIKLAMVRIHRFLRAQGARTRMVLQIHDELLFELHREEGDLVPELKKMMEGVYSLRVPLKVSVGRGWSWSEAH